MFEREIELYGTFPMLSAREIGELSEENLQEYIDMVFKTENYDRIADIFNLAIAMRDGNSDSESSLEGALIKYIHDNKISLFQVIDEKGNSLFAHLVISNNYHIFDKHQVDSYEHINSVLLRSNRGEGVINDERKNLEALAKADSVRSEDFKFANFLIVFNSLTKHKDLDGSDNYDYAEMIYEREDCHPVLRNFLQTEFYRNVNVVEPLSARAVVEKDQVIGR